MRGVCGIAESTKDLTAIGRFGIGFKSVYAFTTRPEIHSGSEAFAIENFVWPVSVDPIERGGDETAIILPLNKPNDPGAPDEIAQGLTRLGPGTLLFLRQIDEISWTVSDGRSGVYVRSETERIDEHVRRITLIGKSAAEADVEETWLVFSLPVGTPDQKPIGQVQVAFSLQVRRNSSRPSIERVNDSPLVVFFPTVVPTHLGFLIQGPYRTTPSRDNVSRADAWNQHLVTETANLFVQSLRWLRDNDMLDVSALRCLPLDPAQFSKGSMFAPLFEATRHALMSEPLLPGHSGIYISAHNARIARTQELRSLFDAGQLATLYAHDGDLAWLSGDVTPDRTPELRRYLTQVLNIPEVTPEAILPRLNRDFLEAQSDRWIRRLYEFLNEQPALIFKVQALPIVRLQNGQHVVPRINNKPLAFLPAPTSKSTDFPSVRRSVCSSRNARKFLESLGLSEPDPIDDVVANVIPKYRAPSIQVDDATYDADMKRLLVAFSTDSQTQRAKLIATLRDTKFVRVVRRSDGKKYWAVAPVVYLATKRLKALFDGVTDALIVDDSYACLRGEDVRELLEACGASRYLQPYRVDGKLTWEERRQIRRSAGLEHCSWERPFIDNSLRGLDSLLSLLPHLDQEKQRRRAALLWESLLDLEREAGPLIFSGDYTWGYSHTKKTASFDPAFLRLLNDTAWVPAENGELQKPAFVAFDTVGWKPDTFLLSKIHFRPPIIETLAKEAGIEPGVLNVLKKLGLTSEAVLRARLGVANSIDPLPDLIPAVRGPGRPEDVGMSDSERLREPHAGLDESKSAPRAEADGLQAGQFDQGRFPGNGLEYPVGAGPNEAATATRAASLEDSKDYNGSDRHDPQSETARARPFVSYVAVHPEGEDGDPDGLDHQARMVLEELAITFILGIEPQLKRTPMHNPGYDLYEVGADGSPLRWIEVKAMRGSLRDRPVGMSHTQFDCARQRADKYWLYVVEHAGHENLTRLVRIKDPAGKAKTFTFDHGWVAIAEIHNADDTAEAQ